MPLNKNSVQIDLGLNMCPRIFGLPALEKENMPRISIEFIRVQEYLIF